GGTCEALKEIAMSQDHNHLNHATWECKYHVAFTPKYRKKLLFGQIRRHFGPVFREFARRKECRIEDLMPDQCTCWYRSPRIFGGRGDRVSEREEFDLGCTECGTQVAEFPGPQILGEGLFRFDRGVG